MYNVSSCVCVYIYTHSAHQHCSVLNGAFSALKYVDYITL